MPRSAIAMMLGVVLALGACGCAAGEQPAVRVSSSPGPFSPLDIEVSGLEAGAHVVLRAETVAGDERYTSRAEFTADDSGAIELAAVAPDAGGWSTADPMGLLWSLTATSGEIRWSDFDEPHTVELFVEDATGVVTATTSVERPGYAAGVTTQPVDVDGVVASYSTPVSTDGKSPGVLVLSGSEGGLEFAEQTARWVAGLGYPAVAVSYFGEPGQPERLERVPVEPVLSGLEWLRERPEVDPTRVAAFGISRGGELALWLAATRPESVAAAIAPVGAGYLVCGYPDVRQPAWTLAGQPLSTACVDYTSTDWNPARIDVGAIDGPVLVACGTEDSLWDSCAFLDDIVRRRGDAPTTAIRGEGASHFIASVPGVPTLDSSSTVEIRSATSRTQEKFWAAVDDVLSGL